MSLYCGIDLHSRNCYLAILNEERKLIRQGRFDNDLEIVLAAVEPYREKISGIAVESTFNWYWLVDGLMAHGYRVHLANTNEAQQYKGLKYADDRHDARWLALMLLLGILPEGYIYPKEERPLRDLCRRRSFLVRKRTSLLISMRGAFGWQQGDSPSARGLRETESWRTGPWPTSSLGRPFTSCGTRSTSTRTWRSGELGCTTRPGQEPERCLV